MFIGDLLCLCEIGPAAFWKSSMRCSWYEWDNGCQVLPLPETWYGFLCSLIKMFPDEGLFNLLIEFSRSVQQFGAVESKIRFGVDFLRTSNFIIVIIVMTSINTVFVSENIVRMSIRIIIIYGVMWEQKTIVIFLLGVSVGRAFDFYILTPSHGPLKRCKFLCR